MIREMKEDGQMKHAIETVPGDVNSICFSPDGTKLASGHDDKMIRVFDVENGDLILGPIQGHTHYVYSVIWSLDGSRLFTASWDRSIRLWDSETGEAIGDPWLGHTNHILSLSLSPDGTKLASGSSDETVRFWGTESGDPIGEPLQHGSDVWVVTFSPSGEFIACGEESGKVSIWRVPWWDDSKGKGHKSLLDRPAATVPSHTARVLDHQFDYLDLPTNRRPSPSRTRLRDTHSTDDPSRPQSSAFSWSRWRTLPRLLLGRSHGPPQHAELTTIYPGFATQRIYVASMDDEATAERPTEPMPTVPGHYPGFSIMVDSESVSSTDSIHENQPTPAPADNSGGVQVSCCALLSRRRGRSGTASALPAMPLTERVAPTSNSPAPPITTPSHPTAQNVLDLPAVVEPPSGTP
ncbi:hypothetical protein PAXINDRAFT_13513 [Paxillus involutus ATCC 200175]|uniref:WD40 repeat-like protein n=1 Tax=Paxillus involutus ATCC 200175 TaxID=664439 RepID=A0A0C9U372_PAXIN|nr:hypothetical protein PAXINDRAFT_13513 [Paxillus involutus ATCC 200175]